MIDIINRLERGLEPAIRPLGAAIGRAIVDMAAPAAPALKPYVRPDGTKVPHLFVDPHGRMVNLTPPPAAPAPVDRTQVKQYTVKVEAGLALGLRLSQAVPVDHTTWKKGPPPVAGWYIASVRQKNTRARYWTGKLWSLDIFLESAAREEVRKRTAVVPAPPERPIEWLRPLTPKELGQV